MNEYDESIVKEFLIESYENLEQIERDLVALEKNPISQELLAGIYRSIHTIKGSSSFLSLSKLEAIAHSGESLLSHLRDGRLILNSEITNALLALVDAIRKILLSIETQQNEGEADYAQMLKALAHLQ
jgi:two-component system chemotaxis sensor kinase CheA